MVKKVTLFIRISRWFALLFILLIFNSCGKDNESIYVEHISGQVLIQQNTSQRDLTLATVISGREILDELDFQNGFAIFRVDSTKIILPKQGKKIYTYSELLYEFEYCKKNINQKYLEFISKNIRKSKKETEDNLSTQGAVSRGRSFLTTISPSLKSKVWKDSIQFSWRTNLIADSLKILLLDHKQQTIGEFYTNPGASEIQVSRDQFDMKNGGAFYWQIIRANDLPSFNAWNQFMVVGDDELEIIKDSLASELNLGPKTFEQVINEIIIH